MRAEDRSGRPPTIGVREQPLGKHASTARWSAVDVGGQQIAGRSWPGTTGGARQRAARSTTTWPRGAPPSGRPVDDVLADAIGGAPRLLVLEGRPRPDGSARHRADLRRDLPRRAARQDLHRHAGAVDEFRPLLVWIGVGLAFLVQTLIAVLLGKAVDLAARRLWSRRSPALMFLVGAVILFREARSADAAEGETEEEFAAKAARRRRPASRAIGASFLVLFAAEWGDLSQLLTISLVAKYDDPVSVFIGAWGALLAVSGLAVVLGRVLLARCGSRRCTTSAPAVCLLLVAHHRVRDRGLTRRPTRVGHACPHRTALTPRSADSRP